MPKKAIAHIESVDLPKSLVDPKFDAVRKLLLESSRTLDKYWRKTNVAKFFDGMSEERRSEMAPFCMEWYKFLRKAFPNKYKDTPPLFFPADAEVGHAYHAIKVTVVACCSYPEIQKVLKEDGAFFIDEAVEKVLWSRRPAWSSDFLLFIAQLPGTSDTTSRFYWRLYRQFVKEKIIAPVKNDFWLRTMFSCKMTATQLKNDPGLLESDIWEFFEFTSFPRNWSLTSIDNGNEWKNAIVSLISEKRLDKSRIVDGCFRSIFRPLSDNESKWYVQLLERIPFDKDEMQREEQRFFDLLNHPNPTPRGLGIKILEKRFNGGFLNDKTVLDYIPAVLREPVKAKAKTGITLLEKIAMRNEPLHSKIMQTALEGLKHEAQEIQESTLNFLIKYDGFVCPEVMNSVNNIASSLPASLRMKIPGEDRPKETVSISVSKTTPSTPIAKYESITPIQSFEELLDLATRLVEGFNEIDDLERFLDGLGRLGCDKPEDFDSKSAAILARVQKKIETFKTTHPENGSNLELLSGFRPFKGEDIMVDIRFAVASWICGEMPQIEMMSEPIDLKWKHRSPEEHICTKIMRHGRRTWYDRESTRPSNPALLILSKRIETVAKNICSGKTVSLLSSPTHHGGWVDPEIFVKRLVEAQTKRDEHEDDDKVLALIRLMPEGREKALKTFEKEISSKSEWNDAVRYALGAEKVKIGKTPHLWIAAARCRTPFGAIPEMEKAFPGYGPDAGMSAKYRFEIKKIKYYDETIFAIPEPELKDTKIDPTLFPLMALHLSSMQDWQERDGIFPWFLSIWPQNLNPVIAASISSHSQNIDKNYDYGFRYVIQAMSSPGVSLRPIGIAALFLGLGMKSPLVHTAATDTAIAAINDGRLTPELAAGPIRDLLALEILTLSRWLKPLKTIVEQSDRHATFVQQLLESIIESLPPKDVGSFLELLYELGVSLNVKIKLESCRRFLETLSGSGKSGKLAKKLLELK